MVTAFLEVVGPAMKAVNSVPRYVALGKLAFEKFLEADSLGDVSDVRVCRPPSCCFFPLGRGVPVSLSVSKGPTPGAAGAVRDSRNRHARPVADPVRLVQYCGRPGMSLRSLAPSF